MSDAYFEAQSAQPPVATAEPDTLADLVITAVKRSPEPLSASAIDKALPGKSRRKEIDALLPKLVEEGRIFDFGQFGRTNVYWHADLETYARVLIPQQLAGRSRTTSELMSTLKSKLRGISEKRRKQILDDLIAEGKVQSQPALIGARTRRLGIGQPQPSEYLADAFGKLATKLNLDKTALLAAAQDYLQLQLPAGQSQQQPQPTEPVAEPAAPSAPPEPESKSDDELQQAILSAVTHINPRGSLGAMIGVDQIWQEVKFQFPQREQFERVMWRLIRSQKMAATKHGSATTLSEEERRAFLQDRFGNYYHTVSLRI